MRPAVRMRKFEDGIFLLGKPEKKKGSLRMKKGKQKT